MSFLDQPTYPNVLQRYWQMGHENTNSVPRRGHAAKCHPGLNMLRQARKILSTTQKLTIEKFLPSLLFSVFVECSSIEYLSCSAPDLASFPDTQLGHFPFCKALKEASARGARLYGASSLCWARPCVLGTVADTVHPSRVSESGGY